MNTIGVHAIETDLTGLSEEAAAPAVFSETEIKTSVAPSRRIFLRGLILDAQIGVYDHEKGRTQRVRVDVDVYLAPLTGPIDDRLENVLDYDFVRDAALDLIRDRHIELQETLAEALADICLSAEQAIAVRVSTCKLDIYDDVQEIGYETVKVKETTL